MGEQSIANHPSTTCIGSRWIEEPSDYAPVEHKTIEKIDIRIQAILGRGYQRNRCISPGTARNQMEPGWPGPIQERQPEGQATSYSTPDYSTMHAG